MYSFFLPASKVQKDRKIMRETDSRMAKYSRRGLIFNIFAFLVCLANGRFIDENPKLMGVLTVGLLVITLVRGFYLFRFDQLYPRAPAKWRNLYFIATLVGAVWWGVILASVTVQLRMEDEAPLLWLYTVIFFSSTAHAFAPYQKFLSYYQFFGQVPAAAAAFYLTDLNGYLYGTMMIVFYLVLTHQCRLISENYWERLEATYALARKTLSMEEEKRDTKANVELNQDFLKHLHSDLDRFMEVIKRSSDTDDVNYKSIITNELGELHSNICDFNGVLSKELRLEEKIFNIRHEIQHLVAEFIDHAESKDIQIETSLSPTLPMRLRGDASRMAQIIRALLNIILTDVKKCVVLVEVEFLREYENAGELYISVTRSFDKSKKLFFNDTTQSLPSETLSLVVAKGLADMMNGSIELNEALQDEQQFRFNAKVDIADHAGQLDFHKDSFAGKNVLLVHNHPRIVDLKRQELDALGFNVFTETQYKRAITTLENSYKFQNPIGSLLFYIEPDNQAVINFCELLLDVSEFKYTNKIGAATRRQQRVLRDYGFDESRGFYYVDKPTGLFEIESMFHRIYQQNDDGEEQDVTKSKNRCANIVFFTKEPQGGSKAGREASKVKTHAEFVDSKQALFDILKNKHFNIVLIDCDLQTEIATLVGEIRDFETKNGPEGYMPIIGYSSTGSEIESSAYELGLDDYIDLSNSTNKTLKSLVLYWSTLVA